MISKEHKCPTCFEFIDNEAVLEYYRLYVCNGPLAVAYLNRKQQEHFSLMASAPGGFLQYGGECLLRTSSREVLAQALQSRQDQCCEHFWDVVPWSETGGPYAQELREREFVRIKGTLQGGRCRRYYEPSLGMWSEDPWWFFDLEITPSHLLLKLENKRGEQETDYILREDGAACHKFWHTYREDRTEMYRATLR